MLNIDRNNVVINLSLVFVGGGIGAVARYWMQGIMYRFMSGVLPYGTIAVNVIDVLPNGNLLVSGEKQIAFDQGAEFVRFSGVVSPSTIAAGNTVASTQVANARFEYRSNTHVDTSDMMSILTRYFLSFVPL